MLNLEKVSLSELRRMQELLESEELQKELYEVISKREEALCKIDMDQDCKPIVTDYRSDRLPFYKKEHEEKCQWLFRELLRDDFHFVKKCFWSEKVGDDSIPISSYFNLHFLSDIEQTIVDNDLLESYENTYNSLYYIKNYIYFMLENYPGMVEKKEQLWFLYDEKYAMVLENLPEIAKQLVHFREKIPNSKLSIGNRTILKTSHKKGTSISYGQEELIEALAFGCSYDKLKEGNFEDAKRLLYVPSSKIIRATKKNSSY